MRIVEKTRRVTILVLLGFGACVSLAQTDPPPVAIRVEIVAPQGAKKSATAKDNMDASNVVIWLSPLRPAPDLVTGNSPVQSQKQITQTNKSFEPHITVVQVGAAVQFPNRDPFLHNVFSLFDGKRFDLGFYEAGSSKAVHFDRAGVSFLFCNIHPEMSAAVIAVDTPYFGISNRAGKINISNVPDGRYQLNVWYERSLLEDLKRASRAVTISDSTRSMEPIRIVENPSFTPEHKNKYGQDYIPPANSSPVYGHP
jgi:plastocyanin